MNAHKELGDIGDALRSIARLAWLLFWIAVAPLILGAILLTVFLLHMPL